MVTFDSLPEAKEYIKQKLDEGYLSRLKFYNGKYVVEIEKHDNVQGVHYYDKHSDSHIVAWRDGVSNTVKAHEVGHKELGHKGMSSNPRKETSEEIAAQLFAKEKMNRDFKYSDLIDISHQIKDLYNVKATENFGDIIAGAKENGIEIDDETRHELWTDIHKSYK